MGSDCWPLIYDASYSHLSLKRSISLGQTIPTIPDVVDAVVVVFRRNGELLMGLRSGGTGQGTWGFVGGKVEPGESIEAAAIRETSEEVGVGVQNLRWLHTSFDYRPENRSWYRVFFLSAGSFEGEPEIREPHKMHGLGWFGLNQLPEPMFPSNKEFIEKVLRKVE